MLATKPKSKRTTTARRLIVPKSYATDFAQRAFDYAKGLGMSYEDYLLLWDSEETQRLVELNTQLFGELCNVVTRVEFSISDQDRGTNHTSDAGRAWARRILLILKALGFKAARGKADA